MLYYLLLIIEFLTFDSRFGRAVCNLLGAINNRLQLSFQTANRPFFIYSLYLGFKPRGLNNNCGY
jgi:hypothetical protein